jgi:protein TonB
MQIPWQATDSPLDPNLTVAVLASAVIHAVVLLILGFEAPAPSEPAGPTLHMVEYRPQPATEPAAPDNSAKAASRSQAAQGADTTEREATSPQASRTPSQPTPASPPGKATAQPAEPRPEASTPEPSQAQQQPPVVSTPEADTPSTAPDTTQPESSPQPASSPGSFQLFPSDRDMARWDRKQRERQVAAEQDRARRAQAATREDVAATYINSFLGKVQRIGNMNYPEEARERNLTGRVRLEVTLRPDGSLDRVRVLDSSGSEILDAAAKQIIRLGAPYSPFPADLKQRYADGLPIRHFFNFTRSAEMTSSG